MSTSVGKQKQVWIQVAFICCQVTEHINALYIRKGRELKGCKDVGSLIFCTWS